MTLPANAVIGGVDNEQMQVTYDVEESRMLPIDIHNHTHATKRKVLVLAEPLSLSRKEILLPLKSAWVILRQWEVESFFF